jgi:hypothetical protein
MVRRMVPVVVWLVLVPAAHSQTPEDLLPAGVQAYIRWDGMKAHRDAYSKTALGKMMAGDTGKFVDSVFGQMQETAGGLLTVQSLLGGAAPEKLQKLTADATQAAKLLPILGDKGIVLAVEMQSLQPPRGQVTLIVPDIGDNPKPLFGLLRLAAGLMQADLKEEKIEDRSVSHFEMAPVHVAWWIDGKHGVVTVGTEPTAATVKRMVGKGDKLTANPLFKKITSFKQFETGARGFLDMAGIVQMSKPLGPDIGNIIETLGLGGIKSLNFYSGFEGSAERGLTEFEFSGPRKGLFALTRGKPFTLADVPPLPEDVISWSMTNFDMPAVYDVGVKTVEQVVKLVSPGDTAKIQETLDEVNKFLGINIRNDLLANLTGPIVSYNSPAEGPLTLGQTFMVKIKEADKLHAAIDQAVKAIGQATGADVSIKKKKYRGVELREIQVHQQGFIFAPTYTIHDGWLVLGYYPQNVQGYILRARNEVPVWKPGPEVRAALDRLPKEFSSISVSDPRPTVKQLLSLAPPLASLANSFLPEAKIDIAALPNAHEATKHLFPNVSVVCDTDRNLRQETLASVALPFDIAGLDTYVIAFGAAGLAAAFQGK